MDAREHFFWKLDEIDFLMFKPLNTAYVEGDKIHIPVIKTDTHT